MNPETAPAPARYDILAIVSSAGGLEAMSAVLSELPASFPAAIVVGQHLGLESALVEILAGRIALPVQWAQDGAGLRPGRVYVGPPQRRLQMRPDWTCALTPMRQEPLADKPLDALLASVAASAGRRALAVVLSGLGSDGAEGAGAVHAAGGAVIVQSEESAAYCDMPRAAARAGAADLVVPLAGIGAAIQELMAGRIPQEAHEPDAAGAADAVDWAAIPIGNVPEQMGELLALLPVAVYACDAHGRFSYWNRSAVELWGREPDPQDRAWALSGAPRALAADGHDLPAEQSAMAEALRTGRPVSNRTLAIVRGDGARVELLVNIRPLHEAGRLVGAVAALVDVTARSQAERALQGFDEDLRQRVAERTASLTAELERVKVALQASEERCRALAPHGNNAALTGEGEHS